MADEFHEKLVSLMPELAPSKAEVGKVLQAQFHQMKDVSNDQMIEAIKESLRKQNGGFPLTIIVLDEMQQFIGTIIIGPIWSRK